MTPTQIAAIRAHDVENPESFMLAFHAGHAAARSDVDTARFLRSLLDDGHASSAAGFLEGLAAARAETGAPIASAAPFWRRNALRRKQVAA
jgi:hypothetical protein